MESPEKKKRILVVEDEEDMADLVTARLESNGFEVHAAASGKTALTYAAEHRPDLVILDLQLPDIHGYQVCQELRRIYHPWDVPILMLTVMSQPVDQLRGFAHGAEAYLTKPFDPPELLKTVKLLLGRGEEQALGR